MLQNVYSRFRKLFPSDPRFVGAVTSVLPNGRYLITLQGGGTLVASSATAYSVAQKVFVEGRQITGEAPTHTVVIYDI